MNTIVVPDVTFDFIGEKVTPEIEAELKRRLEAAGLQYGGIQWPEVTIGPYTLSQNAEGKLFMMHEDGEGMECSESKLIEMLDNFFAENF